MSETSITAKVKEWLNAKKKLDHYKDNEMSLRKTICSFILGTKTKGSKTDMVGEFKMTATAKLNTVIDKDALKAIWPDLSKQEKACIRFKPELVAANYKKIPANSKLHQVITDKPGAPTLVLKS